MVRLESGTVETEYLSRYIQLDTGFTAIIGIAIITILAVAVIAWANRGRIIASLQNWKSQRCLNSIGAQQIRGLICPDGLDGSYYLDRLVLTQDQIVLIVYQPFGGNIFCSESISEWTQIVGQKSYKFRNPLFELGNQLTALRLVLGDVPVQGYLVFGCEAKFPKGHPDCVLRQDGIPEYLLAAHCSSPRQAVQDAWRKLEALKRDMPGNSGVDVKT